MTLLIGTETEGDGAEVAPIAGRATAIAVTALQTGTVERLHAKFANNGTATTAHIAIQADDGGKPTNGVLAEGTLSSVAAGAHESDPVAVAITGGAQYWLTVQAVDGNLKIKRGSTTAEYKSVTSKVYISEITEW